MRFLVLVGCFLCSSPGAQRLVADQQLPDGRWLERMRTAAHKTVDLSAPPAREDLRATAAAVLADLADGSTLKSGPRKDSIKHAAIWLRSQQKEDTGQVGNTTGVDAGLCAYALAATYWLSKYRSLEPVATNAVRHLARELEQQFATPASAAPLDPCACALLMLAANMAQVPIDAGLRREVLRVLTERGSASRTPRLAELGAELVCRLSYEDAADRVQIDLCAQLLATVELAGGSREPADELAVLVATTGMYRVGGATWDAWHKKLTAFNKRSPPAKESTSAHALRVVTLSLYYRYGRVYGERFAVKELPAIHVIDEPLLIEDPLKRK